MVIIYCAMTENACLIEYVLNKLFGYRTSNEKGDILKNVARLVSALPNFKFLYKEKGRKYFHYFNVQQYKKADWFTSSCKLSKLSCFHAYCYCIDNILHRRS